VIQRRGDGAAGRLALKKNIRRVKFWRGTPVGLRSVGAALLIDGSVESAGYLAAVRNFEPAEDGGVVPEAAVGHVMLVRLPAGLSTAEKRSAAHLLRRLSQHARRTTGEQVMADG
jgi:hypothetical protein